MVKIIEDSKEEQKIIKSTLIKNNLPVKLLVQTFYLF